MARRTNKAKQKSSQSKGSSLGIDPAALMERGNYKRAIPLLQTRLGMHPNDEDRRLLAQCWLFLNKPEEVIKVLELIPDKMGWDWSMVGYASLNLERWEDAKTALEKALSSKETAWRLYNLATALARDKYDHQLDDETRGKIAEYLEKATKLENCPEQAYLWLAKLMWRSFETWQERMDANISVLRQGLSASPDFVQLRIELAKALETNGQREETLDVIAPLLQSQKVPGDALWTAFQAYTALGKYDEALRCLEKFQPGDISETELALFRGDTLINLQDFPQAVGHFEEALQAENLSVRFYASLGKARAFFLDNNLERAVFELDAAMDLWLGNENRERIYEGSPVWVSSDARSYDADEITQKFCSALVTWNERERKLEPHLTARLILLRYKVTSDEIERKKMLLELEELYNKHLIRAAFLFEDLRYHYENKSLGKAVLYHLENVISEQELGREWLTPEFYIYDEEGNSVSLTTIPEDQRLAAHQTALNFLGSANGVMIQAIFVPFFTSFWEDLMASLNMHLEIVHVTERLLTSAPEDIDVLFARAYYLEESDPPDAAIEAYKELLTKDPNHAISNYNLSLLLERADRLNEAVIFAKRAVELNSTDEDMQRHYTNIQKSLAAANVFAAEQQATSDRMKAEEQRRREAQQNLYRTARDRWPRLNRYEKQLAGALTVITSFHGMDELAKLSGVSKLYVQRNWDTLVREGIVIVPSNGTYEFNESVRDLAERERTHSLVSRILTTSTEIAYKPIFNSSQERNIYAELVEVLPNYLVFPNMALQAIFEYSRMKSILDAEEFSYYLMASVDFCIVSTIDYLPRFAVEVDSDYHDSEK